MDSVFCNICMSFFKQKIQNYFSGVMSYLSRCIFLSTHSAQLDDKWETIISHILVKYIYFVRTVGD